MSVIDQLINLDVRLFLFLNGKGTETWDWFWNFVTYRFTWIPLYIFLMYIVYRFGGWKTAVYYAIAIGLLVLIVDQTTYYWFKAVFQRPRPSHNPDIADLIRITGKAGGRWGFVSAHASNTFAIAIFLGYQFKQVYKSSLFWLLAWAVFISYSRIYVGVHYPADLICGAAWGAIVAVSLLFILNKSKFKDKLVLNRGGKKLF
ncbi:MAG: phosphatase PAP2 family protein [Flavobacteriales bacterium]|nr:phosphatase PAP2 family protein [Flavobacteriales bacterium]